MDYNKSDEKQQSDDEEESYDEINDTLHGKPVNNLSQLYFSFVNETGAPVVSYTKAKKYHEGIGDEIVTFEKTDVKLLQKHIFRRK